MRLTIRLLDSDNRNLRILVNTNDELESIRRAFRAAVSKKRALVKSDIPSLIPHLIFAFRNLGTIRVVHEKYPTDITYSLQYTENLPWKHKAVMLRISYRNAHGKDITVVQPFFAWLGGSERKEPRTGNQYTRAKDVRAREDEVNALAEANTSKLYTPLQRKLQREHDQVLRENINRISGGKRAYLRKIDTPKYTAEQLEEMFPLGAPPSEKPRKYQYVPKALRNRIITVDFSDQLSDAANATGDDSEDNT
jgi:hypothetical protein